jgi:hypothetical protein
MMKFCMRYPILGAFLIVLNACSSSDSATELMSSASSRTSCNCNQTTACHSYGSLTISAGTTTLKSNDPSSGGSLLLHPGDTLVLAATATAPVCGYLTKLSLNIDAPSYCWNISDFVRTTNYRISKTTVIPTDAKPGNYIASLMISTSEPSNGTYQQHQWHDLKYTIVSDTN